MKKKILLSVILFITLFSCQKPLKTPISIEEKCVYLTFDDGPSAVTESVLKVLDEFQIKATFFVVGTCVKKYPDILKKAYERGHSIGIHSYCHEYKKIYYDGNSLLEDINLCVNTIKSVIPDYKRKIFRFAGGSFGLRQEYIDLVTSNGYTYFDWNASVQDAEGVPYSPQELCQNAINTSGNKSKIILLMHDGANKVKTAEALPYIINYYMNNNYIFKTL